MPLPLPRIAQDNLLLHQFAHSVDDKPPAGISSRTQRRLVYGLLALGVALRLFHFAANRSFFIDELFLSVNLLHFDYRQLATEAFAYEQKAPLGYLWAARTAVLALGPREAALRLVPLLSGLAALLLFAPVARYLLRGWGTVLAVGVLALAYPAVYHAVEAKQYSTELLATVLALFLFTRYQEKSTVRAMLAWGLLGGGLLWFSFSTIFVLAGMGITICTAALLKQDWRRFFLYLIPGALWLVSFALLYLLVLSKYHDAGWLSYFFKIKYDGYLPIGNPVATVKWLVMKGYAFLSYPLGLPLEVDNRLNYFGLKHFLKLGWLPLALIGAGAFLLFARQKRLFFVLFVPVALTLAASALGHYPFYQRFTLFLAPLIILVLAYGAQQLSSRFFPKRGFVYVLGGLVLLPSLANSVGQVIHPNTFYNREYYREAVLYVNDNFRAGDAVYVYWNMRQAYEYYKQAYDLKYTAVEGSYVKNQSVSQADYLKNLQPDFASFKGKKRLWFVYDSNNRDAIGDYVDQPAWYHDRAFPPGRLLNAYFATLGKRVKLYHNGNYVVALYELNP